MLVGHKGIVSFIAPVLFFIGSFNCTSHSASLDEAFSGRSFTGIGFVGGFEELPQKRLKDAFYPQYPHAATILRELEMENGRRALEHAPSITRVSLQGKNFLFSNPQEKILFDERVVANFAKSLPETLQVLDLSLNRFPDKLLTAIFPLLQRENFRFLDVRMNAGADSIEAIRKLSSICSEPVILRKIIWVQEGSLDLVSFLPPTYKKAHEKYYSEEYDSSPLPRWTLPE